MSNAPRTDAIVAELHGSDNEPFRLFTQQLEEDLAAARRKQRQSDWIYDAVRKSEEWFVNEYNNFHRELSLATDNCTDGHPWRMMLGSLIQEREKLKDAQR